MFQRLSSRLRFCSIKDGKTFGVGGILLKNRIIDGTNGTFKRNYYFIPAHRPILRKQHGALICLNRRSYSSYDGIKDDTVINAKDMRKLLKEFVGTGFYSGLQTQETQDTSPRHQITSQDELVTRSMKDSIREAIIPLGDDLLVRDKYLTFYTTVRIGKLMEDMDTLAGLVGYKFYQGPSKYVGRAPFALVTASVDKFDIKESFIRSDRNIWMTGFVSYAGRTSLEITIHLGR